MNSLASDQHSNRVAVLTGLEAATASLSIAIQRLNGDLALEQTRQWLELLLAAFRSNGMYGLQEELRSTRVDAEFKGDRTGAEQAINDAAVAVAEVAQRLYHPKAVREMERVSAAIAAVRIRVADPGPKTVGGELPMTPEIVALRKFAGMLLAGGLSTEKSANLAKARAALAAKRLIKTEAVRLAKNRGVERPPGI